VQEAFRVATVTLRRSDLYPIGTTVGIYPRGARDVGNPPRSQVLASAAVDAAGLLTVTDPAIPSLAALVAYAQVAGAHTYVMVRSTLDITDTGSAAGTGTTTNGSTVVTSPVATTGAYAVGQRISTAAIGVIPAGTYIAAVSTLAAGGVTASAATDTFTRAAHGLRVGDSVVFSGLTGGAGITAGTTYYVVSVPSANTFKVSVGPPGSTPLDVTTDLTAGTVTGVLVMTDKATGSGAQSLVAEGASVPAAGLGADPVPQRGTWRARVLQRRALMGSS
jgi:hypothetical protein